VCDERPLICHLSSHETPLIPHNHYTPYTSREIKRGKKTHTIIFTEREREKGGRNREGEREAKREK